MKKKLTILLLCGTLIAHVLAGCSSGGGTPSGGASSSAAASTSAPAAASTESSAAETTAEEEETGAQAVAIKDSWQAYTIHNPVLGYQLSFYLPEAEWDIINLNRGSVSANTCYNFSTDDIEVRVYLQARAKDIWKEGDGASLKKFAGEESDLTAMDTGNGYPAAVREGDPYDLFYVNMGDLEGHEAQYFLQVHYSVEKLGDDTLASEVEEALLASPEVAAFDANLPAGQLTDNTLTLYFPDTVSAMGEEIALSKELAGGEAVSRVQGVYEAADGVVYTFYTDGTRSGDIDSHVSRDYADKMYGSFRCAEKAKTSSYSHTGGAANYGSFTKLEAVIETENGLYCYQCDIVGVEEPTESHYETAAQLITALAESAEYHTLDPELTTSGLF